MSAKDVAKVVWRLRAVPAQASEDFRCHWQHRDAPTPLLQRFVEQQRLLWSNRIRASDYYQLGLCDPKLPMAMKRSYIGGFQSWRLFFAFNPGEHHHLIDRKLEFKSAATTAGLPVPETLAVVTQDEAIGLSRTIHSEEALRRWMEDDQVADVVVKPVAGTKGWGVLSLGSRLGGGLRWRKLPGSEEMDLASIWRHCARYFHNGGVMIEPRLRPHPILAAVMPNVLHTVRVVTHLRPEPVVVSAALRVGYGRGPADNLAQGGIVVPVDVESGRCGRGTMVVNGLPQYVDDHPVSGTRMTGMVLPEWDGVIAVAKAAAQAFDVQKSIGWDVGLTDRGPLLLEGNWCYDLAVNQIAHRRGMLDTPWVEVYNRAGAYRFLGLGFSNHPRV